MVMRAKKVVDNYFVGTKTARNLTNFSCFYFCSKVLVSIDTTALQSIFIIQYIFNIIQNYSLIFSFCTQCAHKICTQKIKCNITVSRNTKLWLLFFLHTKI